jgi:hypothetical protein
MSKNRPRPQPQPPKAQRGPRMANAENCPVIYFDGCPNFGQIHSSIIQADIGVTVGIPQPDGSVEIVIKTVAQLRGTEKAWKSLFDGVLGGKNLILENRARAKASAEKPKPSKPAQTPQEDELAA